MQEPRDFEKKLSRLEEIVKLLEKGDISLEESMALYREGMDCSSFCRIELENAKHEVEKWELENRLASPVTEEVPF